MSPRTIENINHIHDVAAYFMVNRNPRLPLTESLQQVATDAPNTISTQFEELEQKITLISAEMAIFLENIDLAEVESTVTAAYNYFFETLTELGVHPAYLDETKFVTPRDLISLGTDSQTSFAQLLNAYQMKVSLQLQTAYLIALRHQKALNPNEDNINLAFEDFIELAIYYVTFHELTHSLQKAFSHFHGKLIKIDFFGWLIDGQKPSIYSHESSYLNYSSELERQAESLGNLLLSQLISEKTGESQKKVFAKLRKSLANYVNSYRAMEQEHRAWFEEFIDEEDQEPPSMKEAVASLCLVLAESHPSLCAELLNDFSFDIGGYIFSFSQKNVQRFIDLFRQPPNSHPLRLPE